jgi:hypothetical protein
MEENLPPAATNDAPDFERDVAVAPEHINLADVVTPDEYSALLSPLPDHTESENQENGHADALQPEVPISRWQRKL